MAGIPYVLHMTCQIVRSLPRSDRTVKITSQHRLPVRTEHTALLFPWGGSMLLIRETEGSRRSSLTPKRVWLGDGTGQQLHNPIWPFSGNGLRLG